MRYGILHTPTVRGSGASTRTPTACCAASWPLGTDLSVHSQADLDTMALHHNAKPRKSLGWKSPAELFLSPGSFDFQAYWSKIINPVALGA